MRTKRISLLVALVFLIGAMTLPMTAFAAGGKDTTPPTLTAVLDGETVKIVSSDDNSGVEAVYIDKTRVNSLVDGKASVALKDYAGTDKKVSVYAVDYAGNRSDAVQFDNPYYKEPVSTEKPAAPTQPEQHPGNKTGTDPGSFFRQHGHPKQQFQYGNGFGRHKLPGRQLRQYRKFRHTGAHHFLRPGGRFHPGGDRDRAGQRHRRGWG